MTQVQVRLPEKDAQQLDEWVEEGRFRSRSDAIKTILELYEEREKTREFYRMLEERSEEGEDRENTVPLED